MFKKIATAVILAGGMLIMGGSAFADNPVPGTDTDSMIYAQHGHCSVQARGRVCTNSNF